MLWWRGVLQPIGGFQASRLRHGRLDTLPTLDTDAFGMTAPLAHERLELGHFDFSFARQHQGLLPFGSMTQVQLPALALALLRPPAMVVAQRPFVKRAEEIGLERQVPDDVLVAQA